MITFELIGAKIKEIRQEKGFSQQYMAEQLQLKEMNISRETFNKIENGNRTISALEIANIAKILGVTLEYLIKDFEMEDDLITLFRKTHQLTEHEVEFIDEFEQITRSLIGQEKIARES